MHPINSKMTTRNMVIGFSVLVTAAVILATAGLVRVHEPTQVTTVASQDNAEFQQATAAIYGRLHLLPELERMMLANARSPARANAYRLKRADARHRIDELIVTARTAATSDAQRKQVAQLSAMAARADQRYGRIVALAERRQVGTPLAVNAN